MRPDPSSPEFTDSGLPGSVPVADGDPDAGLLLGVAAAARRLGIAPATLRTWDRRYRLGPSAHVPGRHRRYTADDLARLDLMRRAMLRGMSPADAARHARTAPLERMAPVGPVAGALSPEPVTQEGAEDGTLAVPRRVGGGVLRLGAAGPAARGLGRAAMGLDADAVRALIADAIAGSGVVPAWDEVVRPVLAAVAQRWAYSGAGVEIEHLLSGCVMAAFGAHASAVPLPDQPPVLLAGMPGEQHVLPIMALAAALADRGVRCRQLGADLPVPGLAAAVRRTAPAAVVLWAQRPVTADVDVLRGLPRTRPQYRVYVGGPGWADRALPPRVQLLETLASACGEISAAVAV